MSTPKQPPQHSYGFPIEAQNQIDVALRSLADGQEKDSNGNPVVKSVRPPRENSKGPKISMTSSTVEGAAPAPKIPEARPSVTPPKPPISPMTSADGISIDLPSNFHYYSFKDLYVKPLRVPQLSKLDKAHTTGNLQTQVEAISSVLSTSSGETDLAFKLTTADYNAVLYWLRLTSYSKPSMRVSSLCKNPEHHRAVKEGVKSKDSLLIETVYTKSDLKYDMLDSIPDPDHYKVVIRVGELDETIELSPETMADTIAFLDHPDWADEDFQYRSKIAATLGRVEQLTESKWTWDQRIQLVDTLLTLDQAVLCTEFSDRMDSYGVRETIDIHCKECGFKGTDQVTCDPQTFLTPRF
jgi:hypothetical protein